MTPSTASVGTLTVPQIFSSSPALNNRFTNAPSDLHTSNNRWANVWTVAKAVSVVAFIGISAGAFAFTTVWNPENILFLTIAISLGMEFTSKICAYFDNKVDQCTHETSKYKRVSEIYDDLMKKSPAQLEEIFKKNGIHRFDVNQFSKVEGGFKTLARGLALYFYTNETTIELHRKMQQCAKEARSTTDISEKRKYSSWAFQYDQALIISRIHAAYDYGILRQPFAQKTLSELGTIEERDMLAVCLDKFYGGDDTIFRFPNSKQVPLTCSQFGRSVHEIIKHPNGGPGCLRDISKRLFAAAAA